MARGAWFTAFLLLNLVLIASPVPQTEATFKIGAWGDDASRDNLGVQTQIQTHLYDSQSGTLNYFWVGDDLADGSFIQFGYSLEPGTYCLKGAVMAGEFNCSGPSESIRSSDGRWQWQYWPDRLKSDFYYQIGPLGSAGANGTWHLYTIEPNRSNTWSFAIDGQVVSNTMFPLSRSTDPAFLVAEGTAPSNATARLGPVEFSGLSYYNGVMWKQVNSLIALSYCGISVACVASSYGAAVIGPNILLAGSNVTKSADGSLLWTSGYVRLQVEVHPGVQFFVTSVLGTQQYEGNAQIDLPKGMFAYVSLLDTTTNTPGILGLLGAQDRFQEWKGAILSSNLTAQVLMASNENLTAYWTTNAIAPTIILVLASGFVLGLLSRSIARRKVSRKLKANNRVLPRNQATWLASQLCAIRVSSVKCVIWQRRTCTG